MPNKRSNDVELATPVTTDLKSLRGKWVTRTDEDGYAFLVWQQEPVTPAGEAKPRMDLLPPAVLLDVAYVMTVPTLTGKHGERSYLSSETKWGDYYGAALRHLARWHDRQGVDDESGRSHLAHAISRLLMLAELEQKGVGIDNRPKVNIDIERTS